MNCAWLADRIADADHPLIDELVDLVAEYTNVICTCATEYGCVYHQSNPCATCCVAKELGHSPTCPDIPAMFYYPRGDGKKMNLVLSNRDPDDTSWQERAWYVQHHLFNGYDDPRSLVNQLIAANKAGDTERVKDLYSLVL